MSDVILTKDLDGIPAGTAARVLSDTDEDGIWCGPDDGVKVEIEFADGSTMIVEPGDVMPNLDDELRYRVTWQGGEKVFKFSENLTQAAQALAEEKAQATGQDVQLTEESKEGETWHPGERNTYHADTQEWDE